MIINNAAVNLNASSDCHCKSADRSWRHEPSTSPLPPRVTKVWRCRRCRLHTLPHRIHVCYMVTFTINIPYMDPMDTNASNPLLLHKLTVSRIPPSMQPWLAEHWLRRSQPSRWWSWPPWMPAPAHMCSTVLGWYSRRAYRAVTWKSISSCDAFELPSFHLCRATPSRKEIGKSIGK